MSPFLSIFARENGDCAFVRFGRFRNIRIRSEKAGILRFPIVVLVGTLIYGFTPTFAAATGTASIVVASWLNKNTRMHIRDVVDALALGAHNMITTVLFFVRGVLLWVWC